MKLAWTNFLLGNWKHLVFYAICQFLKKVEDLTKTEADGYEFTGLKIIFDMEE